MAVYVAAPPVEHCTIGLDLILERGEDMFALYRRTPEGVEWLGTYTTAAEAWNALDQYEA